MQYRTLGRTGVQVSEVSLGTMSFGRWIDERASAAVLDQALGSGINLIDTADVYGKGMDNGNVNQLGESEEILGRLLKERRQDILLATKLHNRIGPGINDQGQSRYHIYRALENSLARLQTDYIDLYQVHRFDEFTPLDETLEALTDLVRQEKCVTSAARTTRLGSSPRPTASVRCMAFAGLRASSRNTVSLQERLNAS